MSKPDVWNSDENAHQRREEKTLIFRRYCGSRTAAAVRRLPDIESTLHGDFSDVADQWRSCSSGWLPEDAEQRKWLLASHQ